MRSIVAVLALAALAACSGGSQSTPIGTRPPPPVDDAKPAPPPPDDPVLAMDPRISHGKLANGLTYYILPHAKPEKRAYLWLAVNAGSVQEDDDQQGLAHFVEHMGFNGTERYAKQQLIDFVEKIGMRFGADLNAYTSFDETVYTLQVPTDDPALVEQGLDVLREWAGRVTFDPAEVDKERGVVTEEWRLGRGAGARVFDKQVATLFKGTRYATRLPIGKPEILKGAPRDTLYRYYKDWYRPDLMAVIVVGEIDPAVMKAGIEKRFGDLAAPASPRARPQGGVPKPGGTAISIVTDPELTRTSVSIYNIFAHQRESTEGDYRRGITERLYHQMLNERLGELAQRPEAPFTGASSSTRDLVRDAEAFSRSAGVKDGRLEESVVALFTEVLRVERHGFTAAELERAKRVAVRGAQRSALTQAKRDGYEFADEMTRNFFENEMMPGRIVEQALVEKLVPGVSLDEINRLAQKWGGDDNRAILISGPDKMAKPTEDAVRGWIAKANTAKVEPWVDAGGGKLIDAPPAPGKITATRTIDSIGVTEWTLSNGAKVVVKPTDFAIDQVSITAFSPGGTSLVDDARWPSARFASAIVGASGLGKHREHELRKVLAGRVASASASIGELSESVSGGGSVDDIDVMFQLVHLTFTAPRKDPDAFAAWKARQVEAVRNRRAAPDAAFAEDFGVFSSSNHLRRRPLTLEELDKVSHDEALAIYNDRFGDAGDFTFVIVGNVELATLQPLVETYLASLPSKSRKEKWRDIGVVQPRGVKTMRAALGKEPKASVRMIFHADDKWSRESEIDAGVLSEVLRMRLREILREDMGGVYGVGAGGGIARRPKQRRSFSISFGCAPDAVDKLKTATLTEIKRLQKAGVEQTYLDKVRQARTRSHETNLRSNSFWLSQLAMAWDYGDDPERIDDLDPVLARITNARVKASAKRFLATKQYMTGVLMPEAAAPPAK
jgi:zinc protease